MKGNNNMEELKKLLEENLNDESSAQDSYDNLIKAIETSSMTDEMKILSTILIEKIKVDEETHHEMLQMLYNVVKTI